MKRAVAVALAVITWFALVLQLVLAIRLILGRGGTVADGVIFYGAFFTITTNLLVALATTCPLIWRGAAISRFFDRPDVITGIAASMVLVGLIYHALLSKLWNPQGAQWLANELLHTVIPLGFLGYWWLSVPRGSVHWRALPYWCLYPIGYFFYAMLRGAINGFYPYPFINATRLGYLRVCVNALGVLAVFVTVAAVLINLKRERRRENKEAREPNQLFPGG